jgi:hypothetical protein
MSVALLVHLNRPESLREIEAASAIALCDILNLDQGPLIECRFDEFDQGGEPGDVLTPRSRRVICSMQRYREQASIAPFVVPVQVESSEVASGFVDRSYLSVEWFVQKTPLCFALMAAVTLGLARVQDSEIEDNSGFFSLKNVQGPSEFCASVRPLGRFKDVESAVAEFYASIPKSAEISEWIRSRVVP